MNKRRTKLWKQLIAAMLAITLLATSMDLQLLAAPAEETVTEESVTGDENLAVDENMDSEESVTGDETDAAEEPAPVEESEEPDQTQVEEELTEEVPVTETTESEEVIESIDNIESTETVDSLVLSEDEPQILSEVEEKREEASKTFLMSDGTFMIAQYEMPVHYEDEEGEWKEIDNSLQLETVETADEAAEIDVAAATEEPAVTAEASAASEETEEVYTTTEKAGDRDRIKFSKKLKEGKTVSIKNTEFPLSWGIKGAEKQTVQIETADGEEPKSWNDKMLTVDTNSQLLCYADIFEGVDAEYMIQSGGIKENIILKETGTTNVFEIVYDIGKLTPVQVDERTIYLKNGEEVIYQICAPYMQDAKGAISDALTLSMEQTKKKEIAVTLTADAAWLAKEERVYPVILDPTVLTKTEKAAIDSTFITSGKPSANYSEKFELLVGRESSEYEYCRALVKINLPKLNPGDMVVSAQMLMIMYGAEFYSTGTPALQMNAHQITEDWSYDTVTWNNRPTFDSTVLDYAYVKQDDIENERYEKYFDITEAVKNWYEGTSPNYGIEVKSVSESGSYAENGVKAYFWPERYNSEEELYPRYMITYRNNKGLEDYWSYTTLSAGTAGTAYINDYTGNLVFVHEDVSTTGELMPVTLQHVYNSYMQNKRFAGSHPSAGRGWKLSIQQTVLSSEEYGLTGESLKAFPYAYEDGDGTVHFFYKKTKDEKTQYLDEDGLGLELKIDGSTKTITDKEKNVMTFGPKGNLTSIADARGNTITVTYKEAEDEKSQITKVTDGAGHVVKLEEHNTTFYNLKTITDPSGRATTYTYVIYDEVNGNRAVSKIQYPDGTSSKYTYDSSGALLTATSSDGSGLKFTYTTAEKGKRISKVVEFGTDGSNGQTITFDRSKYNTTIIRTAGSDDVFNNDDDLLTTYRFDNFGRTIATNTKTADGSVYYGGSSQSYTAGAVNDGGSNIGKLNRVSGSSYNVKAVRNLLKNHSAEKEINWGKTYWLDSESEYEAAYINGESCFGNWALQLYMEKCNKNGGGAYYQNVSTDLAKPGNTYTYSGYIKTIGVKKANDLNYGYGACLAVRFSSEDGTYTRKYSDYVTGNTATGYNNGWRKVSLTFTVPEDAVDIRVYVLLRNASGIAYYDGLQLEIGSAANPYNMLDNSSFETISSSKPTEWTLENTGTDDGSSTAHYHNGGNSLKLKGEASANKFAYQEVDVSGKESDIYIVSGWAWAEALPDVEAQKNVEGITRSFDIFARIYYSSGDSVFKSKQADFNRDVTGWQRASMAFDLSDGNDETNRTPTKIRIGVRYYKQENAAYFDSMQLVKDTADSYTYDDEGNLITAKENGEQNSALNYDDDNNLTSVKDAENNLYKYEYNKYKQVTKATAPGGQTVNYTYTAKGPLNYTIISSADEAWKLRSGSIYNEAANGISQYAYVVKDKDQNGYTTEYDIDLKSGLTKSVTTPNNVTTSYTYNANNDLLTQVESGSRLLSYSYDDSKTKLTKISRNGIDYNFTYSIYGNLKKTSVGDQTLSTNTYTAKNGKLKQTQYGNGATKTYTYNTAGNLASEAMNGTTTGSWTYDASQQPLVYRDRKSKQKHTYSYDVTGRLLETKVSDTTITDTAKDSLLFTALYNYDSLNRLERTRIYAGSKSPYAVYSYNKNGQNLKTEFSTGTNLEYSYDRLGRLLGKKITTTTPIQYNYRYYLSERNEEGSETYKTTLLKNELFGDEGYQYEYDKMGNIVKISEGKRVTGEVNSLTKLNDKITYKYDIYGQLIRENNMDTGETVVYTYVNGGNIKSKKIYEYTTEDDLSSAVVKETINYTYDSIWKDKMLSYGEGIVSYDAIGNPITYLGKELTWTGRTLDSLTQDGTTISYTYNADGLRTKKKEGTEETQYYYSNGLLSYEKRSDCELYYTYDADGQLAVINYVKNGTSYIYYPMVNSRGDIEGLYNYAGELKVRYTYDSWGGLINTDDNSTTGIGAINPFRYRGYYYDVETGFYYVSSRYYDPEVGRFISPDTTDVLGVDSDLYDKNLYAYCDNNPVMRMDADGELWITALAVGAGIGILTQAASDLVIGLLTGNSMEEIVSGLSPVDYVSAAISGALAATGISKMGSIVANAALGSVTYFANCSYKGEKANIVDLAFSTGVGAMAGKIGDSGANAEKMRGIYNRSKQVLRTVKSATKRARYEAKKNMARTTVKTGVENTVKAGFFSNVGNFFRKLFTGSRA